MCIHVHVCAHKLCLPAFQIGVDENLDLVTGKPSNTDRKRVDVVWK